MFYSICFCLISICSLAEEKKAEGNAYYKVKDYRKALMCYSRAIELCPECVSYYGNRAACRMMMGQYQEALHDARDSVRIDSTFAKGYVRIAKCCLALGDTAAALNAVNKAEELDAASDLVNEKRSLQMLHQLTEDMNKAYDKKDYRRVMNSLFLAPESIFYSFPLCIILFIQVIYCCDRALEHAIAARHLKMRKAECLALLGRYTEAEEMAKYVFLLLHQPKGLPYLLFVFSFFFNSSDVLRSENNNADALLVRGLCFYYQDNIEQAFRHFKQVLIMAPDHAKAKDIFRVSFCFSLLFLVLFLQLLTYPLFYFTQRAKLLKAKKEEGNEAFKASRYQEAHDLYSSTLQIDPTNKLTNAKLYFNRAVVLVKVNHDDDFISNRLTNLNL